MGYPTKGENHHSGIKNEKDIVLHQNQNPNNAINNRIKTDNNTSLIVKWEHRGGTQLKEDAVAIIDNKHLGISIKNHKEDKVYILLENHYPIYRIHYVSFQLQ